MKFCGSLGGWTHQTATPRLLASHQEICKGALQISLGKLLRAFGNSRGIFKGIWKLQWNLQGPLRKARGHLGETRRNLEAPEILQSGHKKSMSTCNEFRRNRSGIFQAITKTLSANSQEIFKGAPGHPQESSSATTDAQEFSNNSTRNV